MISFGKWYRNNILKFTKHSKSHSSSVDDLELFPRHPMTQCTLISTVYSVGIQYRVQGPLWVLDLVIRISLHILSLNVMVWHKSAYFKSQTILKTRINKSSHAKRLCEAVLIA